MGILRQEAKLKELITVTSSFSTFDYSGFFNDNISNLKDIFLRLDQLLAQKNRRLEAQRKEKDLLEDAVRSLALENNKWQTWARNQLSRFEPPISRNTSSPVQNNENSNNYMLASLENQMESTMRSDEDSEEFYDVIYDASSSRSGSSDFEMEYEESDSIVHAISKDYLPGSKVDHTGHQLKPVNPYGYPVTPRQSIPVDSSKMPSISLWSILKNVIRQQDLTRMPIPINFSEPLSMLQRMCEDLEYFELLEEAKRFPDDPARRLLYIAAFAISSYSGTDKRTLKPFNPLLGETFELITPKFRYISEQVSHHPPIGASHCSADGYTYWNEVHVTSRFRGKYLELRPEGMSHIQFQDNLTHCTQRCV